MRKTDYVLLSVLVAALCCWTPSVSAKPDKDKPGKAKVEKTEKVKPDRGNKTKAEKVTRSGKPDRVERGITRTERVEQVHQRVQEKRQHHTARALRPDPKHPDKLDPYGLNKDDRMELYGNRGRIVKGEIVEPEPDPLPDPDPEPSPDPGPGPGPAPDPDPGETTESSTGLTAFSPQMPF